MLRDFDNRLERVGRIREGRPFLRPFTRSGTSPGTCVALAEIRPGRLRTHAWPSPDRCLTIAEIPPAPFRAPRMTLGEPAAYACRTLVPHNRKNAGTSGLLQGLRQYCRAFGNIAGPLSGILPPPGRCLSFPSPASAWIRPIGHRALTVREIRGRRTNLRTLTRP
jgi:hypothetical protein